MPPHAQLTQARVAVERIQDVLAAEEVEPTHTSSTCSADSAPGGLTAAAAAKAKAGVLPLPPPQPTTPQQQQEEGEESHDNTAANNPPAITLRGDFTWDPTSPPALTGLDVQIQTGSLVAVVGPTGCGKSSLLYAMMGELLPVPSSGGSGAQRPASVSAFASAAAGASATLHGSVAYVPQAPFVLGGSIRDNILFGRPWDQGEGLCVCVCMCVIACVITMCIFAVRILCVCVRE